MTKLTEERIGEIWRLPENYGKPLVFARAIEAELQPCSICKGTGKLDDAEPGDIAFREIDCPECKKKELQPVQEPVTLIKTWHKNDDQHADILDLLPALAEVSDGEHKLYTAPPDQTAEIERLRNLSACEACAEIPSVMEYFKQCEERIATLEAEAERLGSAILKIRKELTGDIHSTNNLLDVIAAERYTKATLEAALRDAKLAIENELTPCGCFQGCEFCNGKMQPEEALATINKALGEQ